MAGRDGTFPIDRLDRILSRLFLASSTIVSYPSPLTAPHSINLEKILKQQTIILRRPTQREVVIVLAMKFNATSFVSSLPLIARLFGIDPNESDEEKLSPTASPSSSSPTETCGLECKTDYGKSLSRNLVTCFARL
jgi:hypothetical protein